MTVIIEERDPDPDDVTYTVRCRECPDFHGASYDQAARDRVAEAHEEWTGHTVTRDEIRWVT